MIGTEKAGTATKGYATYGPDARFEPFNFVRRDVGPNDILIDIQYCGICHSDIHQVKNEWPDFMPATYPMVPGHEIVGRVSQVGNKVTKFKVGDVAGIGCFVDSCRVCQPCTSGLEQFCAKGCAYTYNGTEMDRVTPTYGGYSNKYVVDEKYALTVAADGDVSGIAPLLCAGITTYSPLKRFNVGPGQKVGVVGLGGLGHMAVKLAAALGAEVVLFTTSAEKAAAGEALGADRVVVAGEEEGEPVAALDVVIDTVAASHDLDPYLARLKRDGALVLVGIPADPHPSPGVENLLGRHSLTGSSIGGLAETQEMLDFCAEHGIVAEVEPIAIDQINDAYERMLVGDVRFRFVIDMSTLPG
jgi:alcohol dehydrogenase (NADP+)